MVWNQIKSMAKSTSISPNLLHKNKIKWNSSRMYVWLRFVFTLIYFDLILEIYAQINIDQCDE